MRARLLLFVLLPIAAAPVIGASQPSLVVAGSLTLTAAPDGFGGRLELLEDARFTPDLEAVLWRAGGLEMALDENDPLYRKLTSTPLRNAVLELRDAEGKIVEEKPLERELARARIEALRRGRRTILVTTNLSAGFGSCSYPVTELLEVVGERLEPVVARDAKSGASAPIRLSSARKAAWRLAPAPGGQKDILQLVCRPDLDAQEAGFIVTYRRYHWNGREWMVFTRRDRGCWEDDRAFPASERFPSATEGK